MSGSLRLPRPPPPPPPWLPPPLVAAAVAAAAPTVAPAAAVVVVGAVAALVAVGAALVAVLVALLVVGGRAASVVLPRSLPRLSLPRLSALVAGCGCRSVARWPRLLVAPVVGTVCRRRLSVPCPAGCRCRGRRLSSCSRSLCSRSCLVVVAPGRGRCLSCCGRLCRGSSSLRLSSRSLPRSSLLVGPAALGVARAASSVARPPRHARSRPAVGVPVGGAARRRACRRSAAALGGLDGLDEIALAHPGGLDAEPAGELLELGQQHGVQAALARAGAGAACAGAVSVVSVIRGPSPLSAVRRGRQLSCCGGADPGGDSGHTTCRVPGGGDRLGVVAVRRLRSVLSREAGRDALSH